MKKIVMDISFFVLIILVVLFMAWTIHYLIVNKSAFMENPFLYGVRKMGDVNCVCFQKDSYGIVSTFTFNKTTMGIENINLYKD